MPVLTWASPLFLAHTPPFTSLAQGADHVRFQQPQSLRCVFRCLVVQWTSADAEEEPLESCAGLAGSVLGYSYLTPHSAAESAAVVMVGITEATTY